MTITLNTTLWIHLSEPIDAGMTNGSITGNYNEWAMRSYFGRVNLNWDNKYLLEYQSPCRRFVEIRARSPLGIFPSVSAGWRISEEAFMKNSASWLNQLKLRASYGSLGNNATTSYYMYQSLFATANYILNGNIAGGLVPDRACQSRPYLGKNLYDQYRH